MAIIYRKDAIIRTELKPKESAIITESIEPKTDALPFIAHAHGINNEEILCVNVIPNGKNIPIKYPGIDNSKNSIKNFIKIELPKKYPKI